MGLLIQRFEGDMINQIPFKDGEKYTIYTISETMATTQRKEIIVTSLHAEPAHKKRTAYESPSPNGTWVFGAYRQYRKNKHLLFTVRPSQDLVIPGWGHLDSDVGAYGSFCGNACLNLAGSTQQVRELVEKNINLNFSKHDIVLAAPVPWTDGEYLEVYPEAPTQHGVITQKRAHKEVLND